MKIINNFRNKLLTRNELIIEEESSNNPTFADVTQKIAEKMNVDASLVVVQGIKGNFGRNSFDVTALVYDSPEMKDKVEPRPRKKAGASK